MDIVPYISFSGNCEEAFTFYNKALGGEITMLSRYSEMPGDGMPGLPPESANWIMHIRLKAGGAMLMGSDAPPEYYKGHEGINVAMGVDTAEEADRIFAALSERAEIRMPIQETFWAVRFGMLTDKFGVPWMVNCEKTS